MKNSFKPLFKVRSAKESDLDDLFELAKVLDTVNLVPDKDFLLSLIKRSRESFSRKEDLEFKGEYLLVGENQEGKVIGTSMVLARHGDTECPHIFYRVFYDERYSSILKKRFVHPILRLGFNYDGPTEIGGIVVHPDYRGTKLKIGKQLSYARFLMIGMKEKFFKRKILAELLPPFNDSGGSPLWDNLGRVFTNLDYKEADRLSSENKDFIASLFPRDPIYVSILGKEIVSLIGQVGKKTIPAKLMLEKIGFKFANQIDPFDGGPHYICAVKDNVLIRNLERLSQNKTFKPKNKRRINDPKDGGLYLLAGINSSDDFLSILYQEKEEGNEEVDYLIKSDYKQLSRVPFI